MQRLFPLLYFIIGLLVAAQHGYLVITSLSGALSFVLAVLLWPLVLIGVNLHVALGI